jgi:glycosyltransferase involved in cell wall biosynthesis
MNKKPVLMWLSDSPMTTTGYSNMSVKILNGLSDEYEIHYNAHNYVGQPIPPGLKLADGTTLNFWIHGNGRAPYCSDLLLPRIKKLQPDAFGILLDTFMTYPWILSQNFSPAKTFFYYPSDGGGGLPQGCEAVLKHMHSSVAMAKFGRDQVKRVHGFDTNYIPHAVDHKLFCPATTEQKSRIRSELVVQTVSGQLIKGGLQNKFVVGVVARNQSRKMLDRTIKSFKIFCKDKPNAILYMHNDPMDAAAIFDIRFLINREGLTNRVVFSPIKYYENFDYKDMPKVYQAMDLFLLTTSGEGFGVPIIEAMSCSIPVIASDYTTTPELIINDHPPCGIAVPLSCELTGSWVVERGIMNDDKCAEALTELYNNEFKRKAMGVNGVSKVAKYYSWDVVIPQWRKYIRELIQ